MLCDDDDDQTFYLFAACCCLTMLKLKQDHLGKERKQNTNVITCVSADIRQNIIIVQLK